MEFWVIPTENSGNVHGGTWIVGKSRFFGDSLGVGSTKTRENGNFFLLLPPVPDQIFPLRKILQKYLGGKKETGKEQKSME